MQTTPAIGSPLPVAVGIAGCPRCPELVAVLPRGRPDPLVDHGAVVPCRVGEEAGGGIVEALGLMSGEEWWEG